MAYQKLQGNSALNITPLDGYNIPSNILSASGSATATTASKLVDSAATFVGKVKVGDVVYKPSNYAMAGVTAIDSDTQLSLSVDIIASGNDYSIYRPLKSGAVLYIGGAGNLSVQFADGGTAVFTGILAGSFFPLNVVRVNSTGTQATDIVAIW